MDIRKIGNNYYTADRYSEYHIPLIVSGACPIQNIPLVVSGT